MANEIDYTALAARWLQWVHSIKAARSPISDPTGEFAADAQPEDVWFLAGTFGGAAKRSCVLPASRPLFFPLFNMWGAGPAAPISLYASGHATLNAVDLPIIPVANESPIKINRLAGSRLLGRAKVRMWGLWSHVPGLEPGSYQLEIFGQHSPDGFWTRAHYNLEVT